MARGHRVRIAASAVVRGFVLDQDVEDEAEHARIRAQPGGQARRRSAARFAVGVVEQRQRLLLGEFAHLVSQRDLELQIGHELIEQTAPRGTAGVRGLGEHALLRLGEHVIAIAPQPGEEVPPLGQARIAQHRLGVV